MLSENAILTTLITESSRSNNWIVGSQRWPVGPNSVAEKLNAYCVAVLN